jgi:hypothetical protein
MAELLTDDAWSDLFSTFSGTARHLETRDHYHVPGEDRYLEQFLAGRYDDAENRAYFADWTDPVSVAVKAGKRFERVRVVPSRLPPYLRLEVRWNQYNAEAGEEVSYLDRERADRIGLPAHDFWVFDGERVALMYFTAADRLLGADLITDPVVVERHERWMDLAAAHAVPYRKFVAADPARARP